MIYCSYFISFQNVWRMDGEMSFGDNNNRHHIKLQNGFVEITYFTNKTPHTPINASTYELIGISNLSKIDNAA